MVTEVVRVLRRVHAFRAHSTKEAKVKPIQNYYAFSVYINRIGMVGEHSILVFFDGDFNPAMAGMPLAWIRSN